MRKVVVLRTEWIAELWIAHLLVNGEYEQAVSRHGFNQLQKLLDRLELGID